MKNQLPQPPRHKQKKGQQGEQLAKQLLLRKGYRLLSQNFKTKLGEIDLIFFDGSELVFVEVKARTRFEQGLPEEAVTPHKIKTIYRVAEEFILKYSLENMKARVDVVAVELSGGEPVLRHLKDVTGF